MAIGDDTRSQVAALLTIAVMANTEPSSHGAQFAGTLVSPVINVYEQIYKRLPEIQDIEQSL